jgi:hypothetical protein
MGKASSIKWEGHVLHPVQFEELYRVLHSDYILQYKPEYKIENQDNVIAIEVETGGKQPHFGFWDEIPNYINYLFTVWKEDILKFSKAAT